MSKRKRQPVVKVLPAILAFFIFFSGCGGKQAPEGTGTLPSDTATEEVKITEPGTETIESYTDSTDVPLNPGGPVNILTGLPVQDAGESGRRPYAFVIDNHKDAAKYQSGLADADIIFEYEVEARITRLLALYNNPQNTPKIGPVRSARPVSLNIAMGFDAVYIHAGASTEAYSDLRKYSYMHIDADTSVTSYDKSLWGSTAIEHSLFANGDKAVKKIDDFARQGKRIKLKEGYQTPLFFNEDNTELSGSPATKITIKYITYQPYYVYDSGTGTYTRHGYKEADAKTDKLAFENIIVLFVANKDSNDSQHHRIFSDIGTGGGYYVTNGKYIEITWSKAKADAPLKLFTKQGEPLKINKGKTFISYVNGAGDCQISG